MAPSIPNIKLNSGHQMPQVGFGLWKVDNPVAPDVVYNAIKAGYRLFDGACGQSNFTCPVPFSLEPSIPIWRVRLRLRRSRNSAQPSSTI
jgi:hypothetical protein